jgi:hypothetical protein
MLVVFSQPPTYHKVDGLEGEEGREKRRLTSKRCFGWAQEDIWNYQSLYDNTQENLTLLVSDSRRREIVIQKNESLAVLASYMASEQYGFSLSFIIFRFFILFFLTVLIFSENILFF